MIPKTIHYCWFGKQPKGELILRCIASWKKMCPEYTVVEWNENLFDVTSHPFTKHMYKENKFAFVADYVRLVALQKQGGIYLDTDMLLLQSLNPLLATSLLLGKESPDHISCGMIGSTPHHPFIESMMKQYDTLTALKPNPVIMTELYNKTHPENTTVMDPVSFYPFDAEHIHLYHGGPLNKNVYGVHLWNYSWGHPLNKWFKKVGIYSLGKRITEKLGIKQLLKKLLGFI